ncbi:MAG: c-type cytochrome [Nitrospirota bacterium]
MAQQKSWFHIIIWKAVAAAAAGAVLFIASGALGFPFIFRLMFVAYAGLGFMVFVVLDAPPLRPFSGWSALAAIAGFYLICSAAYVAAGILLPQFTSSKEVEGIGRKTEKYRREAEQVESLSAQTKELSAKADEIIAKLNQLRSQGASLEDIDTSVETVSISPSIPFANLTPEQLVERGKLVYQDHECYNCHKVGGKGGKKRGPALDNIGNLATEAQLKDKIFHPEVWMAEGYEERKKDKMPDKYPDVMSDEELHALVSYLVTLKNPAVETPKPIFPPGYTVK